MEENKLIRFIDSQYNDLFYVKDGDNVLLTFDTGEKFIRKCNYIDDYHVQVGNPIYHICQFAEIMEGNGTSYAPERPPELPDKCYSTLPTTRELITVQNGVDGYSQCRYSSSNPNENKRFAADQNRRNHIVPQQEAAMLGGALYGWKTRAARTTSYDLRGNPVIPIKAMSVKTKGQER